MGQEKDRQMEVEGQWDAIAREKGYECSRCGKIIPKDEYSGWSFRGSKECSYCDAQKAKQVE